ncbi:MAG: response regulator [Runella sp.]
MKKILLIEDSDDIRETTAELLELAGYEVDTAENGKIGVEKAQENKPDLVICDIMMPVLDGWGVLHIFSQNADLQTIPFIFLTAKTERTDFRKGMEMGADDYLTKPFQEVELLNAIERRLQKVALLSRQNPKESLDNFYNEARQTTDLAQILSQQRKPYHYKKKQLIYHEGEDPIKCFYLVSGRVRLFQLNRDGKAFTTALYAPGQFFGYAALIEDTEYQEAAEALEDAEVLTIPRYEFLELLTRNQEVARKFIKLLANDVQERERQLAQMAYNSIRRRTADALLALSQKFKSDSSAPFSIKISREDLASMVGTATESLIRTLSDFKSERLIETRGGEIVLLDELKLSKIRG